MANLNTDERVIKYARDFKVCAVKLTERLPVSVVEIGAALGLHPVIERFIKHCAEIPENLEQSQPCVDGVALN